MSDHHPPAAHRVDRRAFGVVVGLTCLALATGCSSADSGGDTTGEYPTKPVSISVGSEPGSGWDITARAIVDSMQREKLDDTNITVQNQPGAVGCVLLNKMINNYKGDDHKIAMTSTPLFSNELRGQCDRSYTEITMIARILTENFLLAVPADSKYPDLKSLLEAVKTDPQSVPIAAAGDDQLPLALLVKAAGGDPLKVNFVRFESGGEYLTALLNGDVAASVSGVTEFGAQIEAGDLKGLAVLREERLAAPLDAIPTAKELGYDVTVSNWRGVYGPPGMSEEAIAYWQDKIEKLLKTDSWKAIAERNQWETTFQKGDELDAFLTKEHAAIAEALRSIGAAK